MIEANEAHVILVDAYDNPIGVAPKMQAHQEGTLHRAISVVVTDRRGNMLLQQRAQTKYHSRGLWSNAACSHPIPGEDNLAAAKRRLWEEMGIGVGDWRYRFPLLYKTKLDNELNEHEYDHVFECVTTASPLINSQEVMAYAWVSIIELREELERNPSAYTVWFKLVMQLWE
jgi:isopentenyl-diphosphate Delta-isomerase